MIKAAIDFDIARNRRDEGLARRHEPIDYSRLQTLCVIRSGTGRPFLQLKAGDQLDFQVGEIAERHSL